MSCQSDMRVSSTSEETRNRIPTEKELLSVSRLIGSNFHVIGIDLGLDSVRIDHIRMNHNNDAQTMVLQILIAWKQKFHREATVDKLLQVLQNNGIDMIQANEIFGLQS